MSVVGFWSRLKLGIGLCFIFLYGLVEFGRLSTHNGKQDDIVNNSYHQLQFIIEKKIVK